MVFTSKGNAVMSDVLGDKGGEEASDSIRLLFIDAICGTNVPSVSHCSYFERKGLMTFTGNQWNEDWKWKRPGLVSLSTQKLQRFYKELKRMEANHWMLAPEKAANVAAESSTPAITVPDNVLIDPMPADTSPAEPEMWRWTNWERGGVLNGHRITVYFRVVDGVIVSDQYEKGVFLPEFLRPWVGKSLAELQLHQRAQQVVNGQYVGVLKRVGEF